MGLVALGNSVSTIPGSIVATWMPKARSSTASASAMPESAYFEAWYMPSKGLEMRADRRHEHDRATTGLAHRDGRLDHRGGAEEVGVEHGPHLGHVGVLDGAETAYPALLTTQVKAPPACSSAAATPAATDAESVTSRWVIRTPARSP